MHWLSFPFLFCHVAGPESSHRFKSAVYQWGLGKAPVKIELGASYLLNVASVKNDLGRFTTNVLAKI